MVSPHCGEKFLPTFGVLHWSTTWRSLSFFDMDRQVIDLNWKIAHGVFYTTQRLVSFGLSVPLPCFCGARVESLENLFFFYPLAQCPVLASVPYVLLFSNVSCYLMSSCSFWLQLWWVACHSSHFCLPSLRLQILNLAISKWLSFPWCSPWGYGHHCPGQNACEVQPPIVFQTF